MKPVMEMAEFGYSIPAFMRLNAEASGFTPDIIYERYNLFYHSGLWLKKKNGLPYILEVNAPLMEERTRHNGLSLGHFARRSETNLWRSADIVLPVTQVLADKVIDAGVHPDKIIVIQNGVEQTFLDEGDSYALAAQHNLTGKTVLGFTGFVRDWHGVDRVLRYMAQSDDPNLYLLLVGDGPERANLEKLACELSLSDRFIVTGIVQREKVPDYVRLFDIALQPAVVDYASPLKLFEYMAMGKAILAPAQANIKEVLQDGKDSILFNPRDHDAFVESLDVLCKKPELRTQLGHEARVNLIGSDYTWAGNARRVEKLANGIIKNNYK